MKEERISDQRFPHSECSLQFSRCLPRVVDLNDHRVVRSLQAELLSRRALLPCLPPLRLRSPGASELAFTHLLHNQYSTSITILYLLSARPANRIEQGPIE